MDPRIILGVVTLGLFALAALGVAALLLIELLLPDEDDFAAEARVREAERIARGWQA